MKILQAQVDALAQRSQERFQEAARSALRERYPEKTAEMSDAELRAGIDEGMRTSRRYGIENEGDVMAYLYLMFDLGFDFDREVPWARDILSREDFSGRIRIDLLCATHQGRIPGPEGGLFFP
jgi:hypothetical protein